MGGPAPTQSFAKAHIQAEFDSLAREYEHTRERQASFIAQKALVLDMLGGVRGRILELGCGPAVMTPDLLAMGLEVHGVDISPEMLRRARQRMAGHPLENRCRFALGDLERLRYPDAFFDAVLAMGVLEYLPTYGAAFAATARVLKPGGTAVYTIPNRASAYYVARGASERLRALINRLLGRAPSAAYPVNRCLPWRLDGELRRRGLEPVESAACNFVFFPLKELHPALSDSLNRALHPLARTAPARLLGAQYIVKARRIARASRPPAC